MTQKTAATKLRRVVSYLNTTIVAQQSWRDDNDILARCAALEVVRKAMYKIQGGV